MFVFAPKWAKKLAKSYPMGWASPASASWGRRTAPAPAAWHRVSTPWRKQWTKPGMLRAGVLRCMARGNKLVVLLVIFKMVQDGLSWKMTSWSPSVCLLIAVDGGWPQTWIIIESKRKNMFGFQVGQNTLFILCLLFLTFLLMKYTGNHLLEQIRSRSMNLRAHPQRTGLTHE